MTHSEALDLIPTHIYLIPGKDRWQEGDEFFIHTWNKKLNFIGTVVGDYEAGRRPIPEAVRQDMALGLLYSIREDITSEFQDWLLGTRKIT